MAHMRPTENITTNCITAYADLMIAILETSTRCWAEYLIETELSSHASVEDIQDSRQKHPRAVIVAKHSVVYHLEEDLYPTKIALQ